MIRKLKETETIQIDRAQMRLRITLPAREAKKIKQKIVPLVKTVEKDEFTADELEMVR